LCACILCTAGRLWRRNIHRCLLDGACAHACVPCALQHLLTSLEQAKHYAAGLGRAAHAEREAYGLWELYRTCERGRTVAQLAERVWHCPLSAVPKLVLD
jgi:hypothetical protein